jgi:predicted Fe-Mo cluster-binding NifX family protein
MADEKAKLPVFIDKFGLQKPFDAKVCKGAPDVVRDILNKAFGKSKSFEVVKSQPKEKGFDVAGTVQNLEYDEKKKTIKGKLSIVLAETPGRSYFGNLSNSASIDGVNPKKIEASVEELVEALAEGMAEDAVKQCEKKASK